MSTPATPQTAAKQHRRETGSRPGFMLTGYSHPLPIETEFGLKLAAHELSQIPPGLRHEAEVDFCWLLLAISRQGVNEATSTECRAFLAQIRQLASKEPLSVQPTKNGAKFFLPGFDQGLPMEAKHGLLKAKRLLAAIPPKYFAANERDKLEAEFASMVQSLSETGINEANKAAYQKLQEGIRHQAEVCASRAHQADIKAEAEYRLQAAQRRARNEKRVAASTENRGEGKLADLKKVNDTLTMYSASISRPTTTRAQTRRTRLAAEKAAKAAALANPRAWE